MRKTLAKQNDPLIQFRVTEKEYEKLVKMAEDETRTLPNFIKAIALKQIKR